LRGRAEECGLLDGLLADVRRGEGRCLVLRGEAGIGKTALLDYLVELASDVRIARAVGDGAGVRQLASALRADA